MKKMNLSTAIKNASDEGRDKKANRLLRRAAKVENRIIKTVEK